MESVSFKVMCTSSEDSLINLKTFVFHLLLTAPNVLICSGFVLKILYAFVECPICATCSAYCCDLNVIVVSGVD